MTPYWWTATIAQKIAIVNDLWRSEQGWSLPPYLTTPLASWLATHPQATVDDAEDEIWSLIYTDGEAEGSATRVIMRISCMG
jgi:hypothetical protein